MGQKNKNNVIINFKNIRPKAISLAAIDNFIGQKLIYWS